MRLTLKPLRPAGVGTLPPITTTHVKPRCIAVTKPAFPRPEKLSMEDAKQVAKSWKGLLNPVEHHHNLSDSMSRFKLRPDKLSKRWMEYQGITNWDGLLDPLDDNLRAEILRYGHFVDAAYKSFEFDPSSPSYATCRFPKNKLLDQSGLPDTKYKDLDECEPMVESGFLSLYTSGTASSPSLQQMVREEIGRLLQSYGDEPLSLTITGHSLGAALATLAAFDIKTTFKRAPLVTVMSFGGPRVGNRNFRHHLEKQGTKILRIVNSDDLITKVPGFVIDDDDVSNKRNIQVAGLPSWIQKRVEDTQWVYSEVGRELRLSSRDSPYLNGFNVATCHELKTYLHLVEGFVSSTCPFRATAKRFLQR
ncbi:Phospholipase A1 [Quillaja saponaria]|uniref:Phospholipase A1 n=1 Tax=Quillaja saponaria TaxID=32244 RepID=A0AAD7LPP5_QUISA|nr:Phospholipase A1 [Quillaja saponaria]